MQTEAIALIMFGIVVCVIIISFATVAVKLLK